MCELCSNPDLDRAAPGLNRRKFLLAGLDADARHLGAREAIIWNDDGIKRHAGHFDLLISTVPYSYPMQPFMHVLKLDAALVNVDAVEPLDKAGLNGMPLAFGRKSLAGSVVGGIAETQQVIDYCAARNIKAAIELIRPDQINEAFDRVVGRDIRYRFVIDLKTGRRA